VIVPLALRIHHAIANHMELRWRNFPLRFCVVEMERFNLAGGTVALGCVACDMIGLEHEVANGGPSRTAGLLAGAPASKKRRSRLRSRGEGAGHGR
jgi:hypothetical protein